MDVKKIRKHFPLLHKKINRKPIIYFDTACIALKPKQVIDAVIDYYYNYPACGGRSVHKLSAEVTMKVEETREKVKNFINSSKSNEIVFTSNTTEGINIVAHGLNLKRGDVVLTTDREHNSNLVPWHLLQLWNGIKHRVVESNVDNTFNIELFKKTISRKVKLVSMVHTSNFDGYTIPAREIIEIAHDYGALVLLDAAQSVPHMNVDVQKMDVDFLTFSVHKLCGPTGIGVFYGKQELLEKLRPFVIGGGTVMNTTYSSSTLLPPPQKFEGGLQNFAGIIGGGVAINYITNIGLENIKNYVYKLNKMLTGLLKDLTGISIIGPLEPALRGGIFSFNLEGFESHELALILDDSNIFIRSGMHCAHSWFNARKINGCARVSLYFYNTTDEIRIFAEKIKQIARSKS